MTPPGVPPKGASCRQVFTPVRLGCTHTTEPLPDRLTASPREGLTPQLSAKDVFEADARPCDPPHLQDVTMGGTMEGRSFLQLGLRFPSGTHGGPRLEACLVEAAVKAWKPRHLPSFVSSSGRGADAIRGQWEALLFA